MPSTSIMLVPGAAGLASFWDPIRAGLPSDWQQQSLDLPGLGPVPARPDISSYDRLVDHIASDIAVPSVVAGQSMGGYLSLQLALRHPEKVTHLVLIAATGGVDMARHGALDWRPLERTHAPNPAWTYGAVPDLSSNLGRVQIPVLLIWATRDPLSPLAVAQRLQAKLPNARLIIFDTDDHWVARRFAGETALAIRDFVTGQRGQ